MSAPWIIRSEAFLDELTARLPAGSVLTDPDVTAAYAHDQSRLTTSQTPAAVVLPRSTEHVSSCLQLAARHGVPVIARGAGSGLIGAANASADAVVLSLHRMDRILEIDSGNRLAVVQPGVITAALRGAAGEAGLFYPPDPGSVDMCTIGGNIATNAGGMCCVRYGVTADFVLGLEVVLADGRVLRTGRRTAKGVAGYDLTRLFVGSEGTLGIVTEATLKLLPAPRPAHTMVAAFGELTAAGDAVAAITSAGITPSMLEIMDRTTVRAVDAMARMDLGAGVAALLLAQSDAADADAEIARIAGICTTAGATDVATTADSAEGAMLLEARRLALPALEGLGDWLLDDVCVPRTQITALISAIEDIAGRTGLTIGVFGHAGDGNLHPTIVFDNADSRSRHAAIDAFNAITATALELGGTITGEHGVGQLKRDWLDREVGPVAISVHHAIKDALDPQRLLSPRGMIAHAADPNLT
jgi:glycolate oxidase